MKKTRILLVDIETKPNLSWTWGKYEQDVIAFVEECSMLSFAWKWYGESTVHAYSLPDFPLYKKDKKSDKELCRKLWELFDEADIIVAHNGDQFDIKKANAFFINNGMRRPSPYKTIDTKKVAKRYFKFNSNKLDDLGNYLGLGRKIHTGGFKLWEDCMAGDMKAWRMMVKYNKQDIVLLEQIYDKFLGWIDNHPNVNVLEARLNACPNCGTCILQKRGFSIKSNKKVQRYQCQNVACGKWSDEDKLIKK